MTSDQFRAHGRALVDWIADYLASVDQYPVLSRVRPGEVRSQLPPSPPQHGEPFEDMMRDVERVILPGVTHWQSPNFFAFFPANNSGPSILGELLAAGLGVNGMLWATSPACTELETHVLDWVAELLGLPGKFRSDSSGGGVIQDTAPSATLCALLAARERTRRRDGPSRAGALVAYASSQAHSSVEKAMMVTGMGRENLRLIDAPGSNAFALDVGQLRRAVAQDIAQGLRPCFVCATVGTTSSNAIDPVRSIGELAQEHRLWLHVDAAMSGAAAVLPEFRWIHDGIELADSYCFNPHKWMFTNFDCDCFYVSRREDLVNALSVTPEYLKNKASAAGGVIDYRDWQIPLGRRFRALKLWFVIRHYGVQGLRRHIAEHIRLAKLFASWIGSDDRFELAAPAPLNLVCFRLRAGDHATERLHHALNDSGALYLTHTRLNGRYTLRFCVGQTQTAERHVHAAWALMRELAA